LEAATELKDGALPGNRLEALKGDRKGQFSIRINDQRGSASSGLEARPAHAMLRSLNTIS
jgi:hypothetical protein